MVDSGGFAMYCNNCGKAMKTTDGFCKHCGAVKGYEREREKALSEPSLFANGTYRFESRYSGDGGPFDAGIAGGLVDGDRDWNSFTQVKQNSAPNGLISYYQPKFRCKR
jgi:hypothetical protein